MSRNSLKGAIIHNSGCEINRDIVHVEVLFLLILNDISFTAQVCMVKYPLEGKLP